MEQAVLDSMDDVDRLVRREDDNHAAMLFLLLEPDTKLGYGFFYIRRSRERQIQGGHFFPVTLAHPGRTGVGTDTNRVDSARRVIHPFTQCLAEKGDGWNQKQGESVLVGLVFDNLQGRVGLPSATSANHFATVVIFVIRMCLGNRFFLVRTRCFFLRQGFGTRFAVIQFLPVHGSGPQIIRSQAVDRRFLILQGNVRLFGPAIGRSNPQAARKVALLAHFIGKIFSRCRQESIDVGF